MCRARHSARTCPCVSAREDRWSPGHEVRELHANIRLIWRSPCIYDIFTSPPVPDLITEYIRVQISERCVYSYLMKLFRPDCNFLFKISCRYDKTVRSGILEQETVCLADRQTDRRGLITCLDTATLFTHLYTFYCAHCIIDDK